MSTVLTKSKERPILFNGPMVQAILEGRKTVTRRVIKDSLSSNWDWSDHPEDMQNGYPWIEDGNGISHKAVDLSPYGKREDVLWVRETWQYDEPCDRFWYRADADADGFIFDCPIEGFNQDGIGYLGEPKLYKPDKWRPSIFMPYAACRLKLRITDVRVERLKQITAAQCIAEGIEIERDINTACGEIEAFEKFQTDRKSTRLNSSH